MLFKLSSLLISISLMFSLSAMAAETNPWTHTFYFENDIFAGTDSNYTNGVKYSLISPDLSPHAPDGKLPRRILGYIHKVRFIGKSTPEFTHKIEFSFGQNMYTPQDIASYDLIEDDRPYAGWLYVSTSYHRKSSSERAFDFMDTVELQLGIVGPGSYAEETQKLVHQLKDVQRPNGWDHQLKNEPGIAIVFERKWLFHQWSRQGFGSRMITHTGGALGNVYTYLNGGGEFRLGWNIPRDFGVSIIRPAGSTRLSIGKEFSIYGFTAANGKLVLRDIFLDGNTFTDSHRLDKKTFVADIAGGVAINFKRMIFSWTQVLRSREFQEQEDTHSFGAVSLSFSVPFDLRDIF